MFYNTIWLSYLVNFQLDFGKKRPIFNWEWALLQDLHARDIMPCIWIRLDLEAFTKNVILGRVFCLSLCVHYLTKVPTAAREFWEWPVSSQHLLCPADLTGLPPLHTVPMERTFWSAIPLNTSISLDQRYLLIGRFFFIVHTELRRHMLITVIVLAVRILVGPIL